MKTPKDTLVGMTAGEWDSLMRMVDSNLTEEQVKLGWHWCHDFDGLLVGPNMGEMEHCTCNMLVGMSVGEKYEWLWANCKIIHWPKDGTVYPLEHNPMAKKDSRELIEDEMSK